MHRPARGRVILDLDKTEYERMRKVLGEDWEWRKEVIIRLASE